MGVLAKLANGVLLVGLVTIGLSAGRTNVRPLVGEAFAADVAQLEVAAAREPSAHAVRALAAAYLDRNEPGLASAALGRVATEDRHDPALGYLEARALYAQGHASEALAVLSGVERTCAAGADAAACPAWLVAKTSRQVAFLRALGEAGVEDPARAPEAALAALERSRRQSRVVAIAMR
jgi:hypothetical protein